MTKIEQVAYFAFLAATGAALVLCRQTEVLALNALLAMLGLYLVSEMSLIVPVADKRTARRLQAIRLLPIAAGFVVIAMTVCR